MEAIPLNNVIICINRQTITSNNNNNKNCQTWYFIDSMHFGCFIHQTNRTSVKRLNGMQMRSFLKRRHKHKHKYFYILLAHSHSKKSIENKLEYIEYNVGGVKKHSDFEKCSLDNNETILSICYWFCYLRFRNSLTIVDLFLCYAFSKMAYF